MNYAGIDKCSFSNGEGSRVVLWVCGCNHHCDGCQNPELQDVGYGKRFGKDDLLELMELVKRPVIDGLTISGGDPMHPMNRNDVRDVARTIKLETHKSIWMYTGYDFEQIKDCSVLAYLDVIVDGRYYKNRPPAIWRGSDNQRIWRKVEGVWRCDS